MQRSNSVQFEAQLQDGKLPGSVLEFLQTLGMEQYAEAFEAGGVVTIDAVGDIDADLLKGMGLSKQGHITKLIKNASMLRVTLDGARDYSEDPARPGEAGGSRIEQRGSVDAISENGAAENGET